MASLRVSVSAEPKAGRTDLPSHVAVYDSSTATPRPQGDYALVDYSNLDDIVIWLEPANANAAGPKPAPIPIAVDAPGRAAAVDKAVSVGQTIIVTNRASHPQSIYSVSDGNDFDLGSVPAGGQGQFTVKSQGLIEVLTMGAADPLARIYAAPSPWVAMARAGDSVDFNNLPPGSYRLVSWHPRLPGTEETINLAADQMAGASIKVGVNELPKVSGK
jgi:hypothetical protein